MAEVRGDLRTNCLQCLVLRRHYKISQTLQRLSNTSRMDISFQGDKAGMGTCHALRLPSPFGALNQMPKGRKEKINAPSRMCACMLRRFSRVWLFATPWTIASLTPQSMGILQARILEWVAMSTSWGIFPTQGSNHISSVSCTGRQFLYH